MDNKELKEDVKNEELENVEVTEEKEIAAEEVVSEVVEEDNIIKEDIQEDIEDVKEDIEELKEEVQQILDEAEETEEEKEESKGLRFFKKILGGVIDQIISISLSLLLLVVFDLILKLFGFRIAQREPMFLIMYVIVNVIYSPICTSTKLKDTIGRKTMLK